MVVMQVSKNSDFYYCFWLKSLHFIIGKITISYFL